MKTLLINGPVVNDADAWFYDWFGEPYVSPKNVRDFLGEAEGEDIALSINSGGGSVFAGSEIYTMLKEYPGRVEVVVSGLCASIATVIMLAGDTIKASPISQIMIHNASMNAQGDYRDLEHASVVIGGVSQTLINLYATRTGLDEETIKQYVDDETWFSADKALELGFIDEVLFSDTIPLVASAYRSEEMIAKFKEVLDAQNKPSADLEVINKRFADIENKLAELERKDEPVPTSPFSQFVK